jgi:lipopolysaccharide O-acetyltransferase
MGASRTGKAAVGLHQLGRRIRRKSFSRFLGGGFAAFGKGTAIEPPLRLEGAERIAIGSDVFIGAGSWLQALEGGDGVAVEIGDGSSLAGNCTITAATSVRLGRKVLFARNVYVSDHSHAYGDTGRAVLDQGLTGVAAVEIGDGAWLGQNVVVCPGVRIGRGAVVGANSVVLEDVPDYTLDVGAPARVVREFTPEPATTT